MRFATISLVALTSPASAQVQPATPQRVKAVLGNFSFTPAALHLKAGRPVVLHFVNQRSGCLSYSAPEFFGSAVPGGKGALTPRGCYYDVRCTHLLQSGSG